MHFGGIRLFEQTEENVRLFVALALALKNKTGTSKVDAISTAQKAQICNMRRTFS